MTDTSKEKINAILEHCQKGCPREIDIRFDEPMRNHTTFKVGGPVDCWIRPFGDGLADFCAALLNKAGAEMVPVFVLGGGANIVVADRGIRGIVLDMNAWSGKSAVSLKADENELVFKSGTSIDEASRSAAASCLTGLEFMAGLPGTIGGAVYMNARCYEKEAADALSWVEFIGEEHGDGSGYSVKRMEIQKKEFGYKLSPFQNTRCLISRAAFKLEKGDKGDILNEMEKNRRDREKKGHYLFPCAGSAFKNNRDFGKPTGRIIDELGLKGLSIGGAQVAPFHGNIVINKGGATAREIRALIQEVAERVKKETGFTLEPEILFVGEW